MMNERQIEWLEFDSAFTLKQYSDLLLAYLPDKVVCAETRRGDTRPRAAVIVSPLIHTRWAPQYVITCQINISIKRRNSYEHCDTRTGKKWKNSP